jgi:DNA phosphorothioation-associated putative methyltransferase
LGFVINVIEDFDERVAAVQRAFSLARHVIVISAMFSHSASQATRVYRALAILAERLWAHYIELGRPPEEDELENVAELVAKFGSLSRARRGTLSRHDGEELERSAKARSDDVKVMLALCMFSKRRQFRHFDDRLRRDIKAFFGSLIRAEELARVLLFSISDVPQLQAACVDAAAMGLGWLEPEHSLQLHTSLVTSNCKRLDGYRK